MIPIYSANQSPADRATAEQVARLVASGDWLGALRLHAAGPCFCDETDDKAPICKSCQAGGTLNEISGIARDKVVELLAPNTADQRRSPE
jgi:hypothetical protein